MLSKEAVLIRREYNSKYYKNHIERIKKQQEAFWEKKVLESEHQQIKNKEGEKNE